MPGPVYRLERGLQLSTTSTNLKSQTLLVNRGTQSRARAQHLTSIGIASNLLSQRQGISIWLIESGTSRNGRPCRVIWTIPCDLFATTRRKSGDAIAMSRFRESGSEVTAIGVNDVPTGLTPFSNAPHAGLVPHLHPQQHHVGKLLPEKEGEE